MSAHGTHEFSVERARMTRALIEGAGFNAIAVEADWPSAYRLHCFVPAPARTAPRRRRSATSCASRDGCAQPDRQAFDFRLHGHNRRASNPVGFYGLDLYSLHESVDLVLRYLEKVDPEAAKGP